MFTVSLRFAQSVESHTKVSAGVSIHCAIRMSTRSPSPNAGSSTPSTPAKSQIRAFHWRFRLTVNLYRRFPPSAASSPTLFLPSMYSTNWNASTAVRFEERASKGNWT